MHLSPNKSRQRQQWQQQQKHAPPTASKGHVLFIIGATMSSVGKGIVASSMGLLARNTLSDMKSVSIIKVDPYLNCDAGLMSPYEHGEVFVLDDGAEVDLDLGNYERFLDISLSRKNSITTGLVYNAVIQRERTGGYHGKTVQVIPHITDEIEYRIREVSDANDLTIVEIGGTLGDIELLPFVHAAVAMRKRYMQHSDVKNRHDNDGCARVLFGLVSYVPCVTVGSSSCSEQKTKPTQHAVAQLRSYNIDPDFIFCRADTPLCDETKDKIASATCIAPDVNSRGVFSVHNVPRVTQVPCVLKNQGAHYRLAKLLGCESGGPLLTTLRRPQVANDDGDDVDNSISSSSRFSSDSSSSSSVAHSVAKGHELVVFILGKYLADSRSSDTYLSVCCALEHACAAVKVNRLKKVFVNSKEQFLERIHEIDTTKQRCGLLIPGGFGVRGVEDKIEAVLVAREYRIPILGICLGLQVIAIAAARYVHPEANSTEFNANTPYPIVWKAPGYGGKLRCGGSEVRLVDHLLIENYSRRGEPPVKVVRERHRHRYILNDVVFKTTNEQSSFYQNNDEEEACLSWNPKTYNSLLEEVSTITGLCIAAVSTHCIEAVNWPLPDMPNYYCYGFQYHPEFTSRSPSKPSGAFRGFIESVKRTVPVIYHYKP